MKKILIACLISMVIGISYNVYASIADCSLYANLGCDDDPRVECRVWVVTQNGATTVKEPGINSMSLEEPGGKE